MVPGIQWYTGVQPSLWNKGLGMSPSRDRASSYVGPAFLKCGTVSRVPPSSGGSHRTVAASHRHVRISAARGILAVWSPSQGGGAPGRARTRRPSIPYGAPGLPAAIPWSLRPTGAQGPPQESRCVAIACVVPIPPVGRRRIASLGLPVCVLSHTTCSTRAPTLRPGCAPPMRSDDPQWEERASEVLRETLGQVPVAVGILLGGTLKSAVQQAEGGHEVPAGTGGHEATETGLA